MSKDKAKDPCDTPLEEALISGLTELRDTIQEGIRPEERFTMRTVDIDLEPQTYEAADVKRIRNSLNASQAVFAKLLAVSVKTVQSWEQGTALPPMARRLLDMIDEDRERWLELLRESTREHDEDCPTDCGCVV